MTDQWNGYIFLNANDSGFSYIVNNHSRSSFSMGIKSKSRIERILGQLKEKIKKLYHNIPSKNFLYFLQEAEYRLIIIKYRRDVKMDNFAILYLYLLMD